MSMLLVDNLYILDNMLKKLNEFGANYGNKKKVGATYMNDVLFAVLDTSDYVFYISQVQTIYTTKEHPKRFMPLEFDTYQVLFDNKLAITGLKSIEDIARMMHKAEVKLDHVKMSALSQLKAIEVMYDVYGEVTPKNTVTIYNPKIRDAKLEAYRFERLKLGFQTVGNEMSELKIKGKSTVLSVTKPKNDLLGRQVVNLAIKPIDGVTNVVISTGAIYVVKNGELKLYNKVVDVDVLFDLLNDRLRLSYSEAKIFSSWVTQSFDTRRKIYGYGGK